MDITFLEILSIIIGIFLLLFLTGLIIGYDKLMGIFLMATPELLVYDPLQNKMVDASSLNKSSGPSIPTSTYTNPSLNPPNPLNPSPTYTNPLNPSIPLNPLNPLNPSTSNPSNPPTNPTSFRPTNTLQVQRPNTGTMTPTTGTTLATGTTATPFNPAGYQYLIPSNQWPSSPQNPNRQIQP